ncbi:MAG: hypothetical protein IT318_04745 [Anaerolineales bacterium]|nr:hypothetical protein [Anaerolineales bacterium]
MRIVTNEKLIKRNSQIGRYSVLVGTVLLIGALVINLLAFTRPNDSALLFYVIAAFFVGFTLTNIGTLFNNRWGRRPDKGLADSLKGLDDRYALYSYRLGASHLLAGPSGLLVLVPKYQTGPVEYDGKRWRNPGARRIMLGLFNPDPLGNPILEAASEVEAFSRFANRHDLKTPLVPQAMVVFLHPRAEVSANAAPLPVLHFKQLKDTIRRLPRDAAATPAELSRLEAAAA